VNERRLIHTVRGIGYVLEDREAIRDAVPAESDGDLHA
jgi:hypothetical protein